MFRFRCKTILRAHDACTNARLALHQTEPSLLLMHKHERRANVDLVSEQ